MSTELVLAFVVGVLVGITIISFMIGAHRSDLDPADTDRMNFLHSNRMSLDCSPEGETWGVLGDFPRDVKAIGLTPRQAIDRAKGLPEEGQ